MIGWLGTGAPPRPSQPTPAIAAFRAGLAETGYVEGRNVALEFRWAEWQYDRLPALAADLVRRGVAMIFATSTPTALAAKSATTTIPIVFSSGADPVEDKLVASLNHPGANITGVTILTQELIAKRMELLHEIVPAAATIGYLLDPTGSYPEAQTKNAETAARVLGMQLAILNASTLSQIETAFATLVERRIDALMIGNGFVPRNTGEDPESHKPGRETIYEQLPRLAARHGMPVIYAYRQFVDAGGLISYGASLDEEPAPMRAASSGARSLPTCRSCSRPSLSWSSTSRPPRRSASPSRKLCWPPRMR